jgi:hypothetical protein
MAMRRITLVAIIIALSGCSAEPVANNVDAVSPAEAQALNDAAEMLDQTEPPPRLTDGAGQAPTPPKPTQ